MSDWIDFVTEATMHTPSSGGSLTREQFLLREIRIVARLRADGVPDEEIVARAKEENIFQYPTVKMATNIARVCLKRLDNLAQPSLQLLLAEGEGTYEEAAQCNLYAMARSYRLMRAFLADELAEHYRTFDYQLSRMDINAFFTRLRMRDTEADSWTDATFVKLSQVLRKSLAEAGMLASSDSEDLLPVLLEERVKQGILANGDADLLPAFNCMEALYATDDGGTAW